MKTSRLDPYLAFAAGVSLGVIATASLAAFSSLGVWDDAYMFIRYADNLLQYRALSWQPGGPPTYGLSSLAYLAVVVPVRLMVHDNPVIAIVASSVLCGIAFLWLLARLVHRHATADPELARLLVASTFGVIAMSVSGFAPHVVSGMDTMFVLAYVTAYLLILEHHETRLSAVSAVLLALWSGLAFWVRPDLLVYTFSVALALLVFARSARARRQAAVITLTVVLATLAEMALAAWYFDSALPLPFYAKSLTLYGDFIYTQYRFMGPRELLQYVQSYGFFLVPLAAVWLCDGKRWWQRSTAGEKGLVVATAVFATYYTAAVLQIMGSYQRFYYPTLPVLAFLSARSVAHFVDSFRSSFAEGRAVHDRSLYVRLRPYAAAALALALIPQMVIVGGRLTREITAGRVAQFGLLDQYRNTGASHRWFALDDVSRLPDGLVIATTEVGLPAVMNPRKTVLDLAGLNETDFARHGVSADRLFQKYRPDVIYLPYPHYRELISDILQHPEFIASYECFPSQTIGTDMGFAVRRDSAYAEALRQRAHNSAATSLWTGDVEREHHPGAAPVEAGPRSAAQRRDVSLARCTGEAR